MPSAAFAMANYCVLVLLMVLSAAQACRSSEIKTRAKHLPPVLRRVLHRGLRTSRDNRRSLPDVVSNLAIAETIISLNPDTVHAVAADDKANFHPPAWRNVSRCLRRLQRLDANKQAAALCADDPENEECVTEVLGWIHRSRVSVSVFALLRTGYDSGGPNPYSCPSFNLVVPLPRVLARISRLSHKCVETDDRPEKTLTVQDYVQGCLALIYYHPGALNAWCEYMGIPKSLKLTLSRPMKLPLWFQAALTFYLMHTQPGQQEQAHFFPQDSTHRLLLPPSAAETTMMDVHSIKAYLRKLNDVLPLRGGPFDLSIEQCAERVAYWTIQTNLAPTKAL